MKSFIRYLYEYQNGKRTRNTGFVKVLEQTDTAEIQIYGRGFPVAGGRTLEIYLFYEEDGKCIGIRMVDTYFEGQRKAAVYSKEVGFAIVNMHVKNIIG